MAALVGVFAVWAAISLAELPPLANPLKAEELNGWQLALAAAGVVLYALAAVGYLALYRRRGTPRFVLAVTLAFALLAEAMVVIAWARNWHVSWWEWHLLMLAAFLVITRQTARSSEHEERFSALYLDRTLAGARDVSVVLADLSGFAWFFRTRRPDEVAMLNVYFEAVVPLLQAEGGEVHQIVGDKVMAIFNKQGDTPDHPGACGARRARPADRRGAGCHRSPGLAALPDRREQRRSACGFRGRRERPPQARRGPR